MSEKYKPPESEALMACKHLGQKPLTAAGSWAPADFIEVSGIGDVNSDARGSGARYNAGKPAMELLPLRQTAMVLVPFTIQEVCVRRALVSLGEFQSRMGDDETALCRAFGYVAEAADMRVNLLIVEAAKVFDYGRRKYAEWNWAKGMPWNVPIGCAARHLLGTPDHPGMWDNAQAVDHESGLLSAGHVACNILMLAQYLRTYREGDDRPKTLEELAF